MPQKLDPNAENLSRRWKLFQQAWSNYEVATELNKQTHERRIATLLAVIGEEALELYNTFEWTGTEGDKIEGVLKKFEEYCQPKKNTTYARF